MARHDETQGFATLEQSRAAVRLAVAVAGSCAELAAALGVRTRTVQKWRWVHVPEQYAAALHAFALRAPLFAQRNAHKVRVAAVLAGSQAALSEQMGVRHVRISKWVRAGIVPRNRERRATLDAALAQLLDRYMQVLQGAGTLDLPAPRLRGRAAVLRRAAVGEALGASMGAAPGVSVVA